MIRRAGSQIFRRGWKYSVSYLFNASHLVNMVSALSQLRVLASHKTNFESVAQRRLGIRHGAFGRCNF